MISPMKIETALPTHFERLVAIWESSVRATHHFYRKAILRRCARYCSTRICQTSPS